MGLQSRQPEMNHTESGRGVGICPVCNQEGRRITCTSGSKSEVIFYHPEKILRTICYVAATGIDSEGEVIEEPKTRNKYEADTVETR